MKLFIKFLVAYVAVMVCFATSLLATMPIHIKAMLFVSSLTLIIMMSKEATKLLVKPED